MEKEDNHLTESTEIEKTKIILDVTKTEYLAELTRSKTLDEKINRLLTLVGIILVALTTFSTSGFIIKRVGEMVFPLNGVYWIALIILVVLFILSIYMLISGLRIQGFSGLAVDKSLFKQIKESNGIAHSNMIIATSYSKYTSSNIQVNYRKAEKVKKAEFMLNLILLIFSILLITLLISFLVK